MKKNNTAYWITTALVALAFTMGGAMDLIGGPEVVATLRHLGYAPYVATLLGLWKLLAVPAILAPGLPRLKEWAYAGIMFDLTGASVSHAASGDGVGEIITPLVILGIAMASWALRPADRMLAGR